METAIRPDGDATPLPPAAIRYLRFSCLGGLLVAALVSCGLLASKTDSMPPCLGTGPECQRRLEIGGGWHLRYLSTFPLDQHNPAIRQLLIIVHGTDRDWRFAFQVGLEGVGLADRADETLVISPFFQLLEDDPAPDEAYWTSGGWRRGHLSVPDALRSYRVSSYDVIDQFLHTAATGGRFPQLEQIVVAGHSAGGQFTHRYAAGGRAEQELSRPVRYVVANPSTYLYLGPERAVAGTLDSFELPDAAACADYQVWHYGLENLNSYMNAWGPAAIRSNLTGRDVWIMVGNQDVGHTWLDMSCGAMLQGPHRYYRGLILVEYMNQFWPGHHHVLRVVGGVAHSSRGMFTSVEGREALFGW